jgi:hypothetical protein
LAGQSYKNDGIKVRPGDDFNFRLDFDDLFDQKEALAGGSRQPIDAEGPYEIKIRIEDGGATILRGDGSRGQEYVFQVDDPHNISTGNIEVHVFATSEDVPESAIFPLKIVCRVKDIEEEPTAPDEGSKRDPEWTVEWNLTNADHLPTSLEQYSNNPAAGLFAFDSASYSYHARPDLNSDGVKDYTGVSISETFSSPSPEFNMSDVDPTFAMNHSLTNAIEVANFCFSEGSISSFIVNVNDDISDQHGGWGSIHAPVAIFKSDLLGRYGKELGWSITQEYHCGGEIIGSAVITRIMKDRLQVKKSDVN